MSIVSSLLLALLYVSFYSSKARSLGLVVNEVPLPAKKLEDSNEKLKDNDKLNSARVSTQVDMKSTVVQNTIEEAKEGAGFENKKVESESNNNEVKLSRADSREFVSWRVPHEKGGEPEVPGFNLDYLPPRTHPPAHN